MDFKNERDLEESGTDGSASSLGCSLLAELKKTLGSVANTNETTETTAAGQCLPTILLENTHADGSSIPSKPHAEQLFAKQNEDGSPIPAKPNRDGSSNPEPIEKNRDSSPDPIVGDKLSSKLDKAGLFSVPAEKELRCARLAGESDQEWLDRSIKTIGADIQAGHGILRDKERTYLMNVMHDAVLLGMESKLMGGLNKQLETTRFKVAYSLFNLSGDESKLYILGKPPESEFFKTIDFISITKPQMNPGGRSIFGETPITPRSLRFGPAGLAGVASSYYSWSELKK